MAKFKVGDRVKIIQGGYGCHPDDIGKETTILEYMGGRSTGYLYKVDRTELSRYTAGGGAFEQSFELAEKQVKNILNADIAKFGLHVNLNLDLAKEMVIEGKGIPAVYYMENTLILTAHHYGDGKVDLEATPVGERLFDARQDIKMSYELDILEDMVINALQYAIQDQFDLRWPITIGDITVKPDGLVHTENTVIGSFAISSNLESKEVLFSPKVGDRYALRAETLKNIATATTQLQELYGQALWKSGL